MTKAAAGKLNRNGGSRAGKSYLQGELFKLRIKAPNGRMRRLNAAEINCISAVCSLNLNGKPAEYKLRELGDRFNYSLSTVFRAIKTALKNDFIKRGDRVTQYTYEREVKENYFRSDDWLHFATFEFRDDDGKLLSEGYLTEMQIIVLCKLRNLCKMSKRGLFRGSDQAIGRIAGIANSTVSAAIKRLKQAGVIFLPRRAKNSHEQATYSINEELLRVKRSEVVKSRRSANALETAESERIERERWYAERHHQAEARAAHMQARARKDKLFAAADEEVKLLEIEAARLEALNPDAYELTELLERLKKARSRRNARLLTLNMVEDDLIPHYACATCSDTGFTKDGFRCSCYERRQR